MFYSSWPEGWQLYHSQWHLSLATDRVWSLTCVSHQTGSVVKCSGGILYKVSFTKQLSTLNWSRFENWDSLYITAIGQFMWDLVRLLSTFLHSPDQAWSLLTVQVDHIQSWHIWLNIAATKLDHTRVITFKVVIMLYILIVKLIFCQGSHQNHVITSRYRFSSSFSTNSIKTVI